MSLKFTDYFLFLRETAAAAARETTAIAEATPIISAAPVLGFFSELEPEPPLLPEPEPEPPLPVFTFSALRMYLPRVEPALRSISSSTSS